MSLEKGRVCVTGAGGFIASWVVKLLLSKGYYVHGAVRNPGMPQFSNLTLHDLTFSPLSVMSACPSFVHE